MNEIENIEQNPEFKEQATTAGALVENASRLKVTDKTSLSHATSTLTQVCKVKKGYEDLRKKLVKPIKAAAKNIDDFFKMKSRPIVNAEGHLRKEILDYQDAEDQKRRDAEARERREHEAAQKTARNLGMGSLPAPLPALPPEKTTRTATGSATTTKRWTFEVVDLSKVPVDFVQIDAPMANASIRSGVREIPGLKIFEKSVLTVR